MPAMARSLTHKGCRTRIGQCILHDLVPGLPVRQLDVQLRSSLLHASSERSLRLKLRLHRGKSPTMLLCLRSPCSL